MFENKVGDSVVKRSESDRFNVSYHLRMIKRRMIMKVKVTKVSEGSHPSEVIVSVDTTAGPERLVVHQRSLQNDGLDIGYPINREDSNYLIELPRETISGSWRVWVPASVVTD